MKNKQLNKKQTVAIYVRLSRSDDTFVESQSIAHQLYFLTQYANKKGYEIYDTYVDDGFSGTSFDRPSMQRLIYDINKGVIDILLVKDLSRLGRLESGLTNLLDEILPSKNCRLLAIDDNVDTKNGYDDIVPLRAFFNEYYCKDVSTKIRSARKTSIMNGKFYNSIAPYGYQKSKDDVTKLVVDENVRDSIKLIFELRAKGISRTKIANVLNNRKILTAKDYYNKCLDSEYQPLYFWRDSMVKRILSNEVYIGNIVSGKHANTSYKNRKRIYKDEDEWRRAENTHEPIISIDLWNAVQQIENKAKKNYDDKLIKDNKLDKPLFTGFTTCADCGGVMSVSTGKYTVLDGTTYYKKHYSCKAYRVSGKSKCSPHNISESTLLEIIKNDLKAELLNISEKEQIYLEKIKELNKTHNANKKNSILKEKQRKEKELESLQNLSVKIYEDKVSGTISKEHYKLELERLTIKMSEVKKELEELVRLINFKATNTDENGFKTLINKYFTLEKPTKELLQKLIESVEIFETEEIDRVKTQQIKINYKFKKQSS